MLLVSSITPSGRAWAIESARSTLPGARLVDASDFADHAPDLAGSFGLLEATVRSAEVVGALGSFRDVAMMLASVAQVSSSSDDVIVVFPGSVTSAMCDLRTLAVLEEVGAASGGLGAMGLGLQELVQGIEAGDVEWLLACPPEESALHDATIEIAVGLACGVRIRGVAICPMPRKSDGWPKSLRASARERVEQSEHAVHPVPVRAAKRGVAPSFIDNEGHHETPTVSQVGEGEWVWSVTLPGMSAAQIAVGTWTSDPTYPCTHVVIRLDRWTIHRPVNTTLRRCEAVEAVTSGDSLAVTFVADAQHWPQVDEDLGERGDDE